MCLKLMMLVLGAMVLSMPALAEQYVATPARHIDNHIATHKPKAMDEDNDGKITLFEFMWHKREFFDMLDTNGDEAISDRELGDYKQAVRRVRLMNKKAEMMKYHQGLLKQER